MDAQYWAENHLFKYMLMSVKIGHEVLSCPLRAYSFFRACYFTGEFTSYYYMPAYDNTSLQNNLGFL